MITARPTPRRSDSACLPISDNCFQYRDTCNVYLLRAGREGILIDFGSGGILEELPQLGVDRVSDVLVTHHHRDQLQGLQRAVEAGIRIWVPAAEADLVHSVDAHWQAREVVNSYNNRQDRFSLLEPIPVSGTLRDYSTFSWPGGSLRVEPTPGHTVGSITLVTEVDGRRTGFSGDLLAGPGRVWSLAATQWTYNGAEGVAASIASLLALRRQDLDRLLPSHGQVMSAPEEAIELTVDRLRRLLALRREHHALFDLWARPYEALSPHLLRNRSSVAASYVLLSDRGRALLVDFGYDFSTGLAAGSDRASRRPWLLTIPALERDHGVERIDAVIPTHYHDDHVAGLNLLRQVEGTQVWAPDSFASVLERPELYDLPCLWYDPIPVDRRLPLETPIHWEGYALTLHHQPGHTRHAAALEVEVDGARVLLVGDQMGDSDGLGLNYVYQNGFEVSDYRASAELYARLRPDLILTGHWPPLRPDAAYFAALRQRGQALESVHRDLLAAEALELMPGGAVASLRPYRIEARAGRAFEVRVEVRNPSPRPQEVGVRLVTPTGWPVQPGEGVRFCAPGEGVEFSFRVAAPPHVALRRARLAADVRLGSRPLGQLAEGLVTVR
jgi:glyoxylase-like metal-dependent hydrolase (beta-lactamase superfamily II)